MKVVLLHGPAKAASRRKLLEIKQKFDPNNAVVFEEGSKVADMADNLMASSLFTDERLVILENPDDIDFLPTTHYPLPATLLLWFDHEITKSSLLDVVKKNNGEVLFFPESKEVSVFPFLDLLAAGNSRAFLEMKKLKEANYDVFYFLSMVFYLLRNLVATPKTAPQFVKVKLQKQRARFNQQNLIKLYHDVLDLDFKLKSGLIDSAQVEFMLVNKFTE